MTGGIVLLFAALWLLGPGTNAGTRHCRNVKDTVLVSQKTGECLNGCETGWYSPFCDVSCSQHCPYNVCDNKDGTCMKECNDGRYGEFCEHVCSENCRDGMCQPDGSCTECESGFAGRFCDFQCSENCNGSACNITADGTPICVDGCRDGFTGIYCQEICPDDCARCDTNGTCLEGDARVKRDGFSDEKCFKWNQTTGMCKCCKSGWRGDDCSTPCDRCAYNYAKDACTHACQPNYWGYVCNVTCPKNCAVGLDKIGICNKTTGRCSNGCLKGYHGTTCNNTCGQNCKMSICDQDTGNCHSGCEGPWFDRKCDSKCSKHCREDNCDELGYCLPTKTPHGSSCSSRCKPDRYGKNCTFLCGRYCEHGCCSVNDSGVHACDAHCLDNYMGSLCIDKCPDHCIECEKITGDCTKEKSRWNEGSTAAVVLVVLGGLVVLAVVARKKGWCGGGTKEGNGEQRLADDAPEDNGGPLHDLHPGGPRPDPQPRQEQEQEQAQGQQQGEQDQRQDAFEREPLVGITESGQQVVRQAET